MAKRKNIKTAAATPAPPKPIKSMTPQEFRALVASMKSPSALAMMPDASRYILCHDHGVETAATVPTEEETAQAIDVWLAKIDAAQSAQEG